MKFDYLYVNPTHASSKDWAIVVLPEIFGIHPFIKQVTDNLAEENNVLALALDHLYAGTGKVELYDYDTGGQAGMAAMSKVTGENYIKLLKTTLNKVQELHPEIKHFVILGFCFGGRLALLSGIDARVSKIISFYGGGPHTEFYQGKGSIEALVEARANSKLSVLAFYGEQDKMIPDTDRDKTKNLLEEAGIVYQAQVYDAGHAFANFERASYNEAAANQAWVLVKQYLAND